MTSKDAWFINLSSVRCHNTHAISSVSQRKQNLPHNILYKRSLFLSSPETFEVVKRRYSISKQLYRFFIKSLQYNLFNDRMPVDFIFKGVGVTIGIRVKVPVMATRSTCLINTLRPGQDGRNFGRRQFRQMKYFNFNKYFTELYSWESNWQ